MGGRAKAILIVCDGLGDRPIPELGGMTPLEAADTANLNRLADRGATGYMSTIGVGIRPGSDTAHLAILGYDPRKWYGGRGPIEAAGTGLKLRDGDLAFRGNLGTVADDGTIIDRRAGRISSSEPFVPVFDGKEIDGVKFIARAGTAYRVALVMRGEGLSAAISDVDPHEAGKPVSPVRPLDDSPEAARTARVLNEFLRVTRRELLEHPENAKRRAEGKLEANYLLLRGAGLHRALPSFEERYGLKAACVAGAGLYKGVAALAGMDVVEVEGATGLPDTDVRAKFERALSLLDEGYDFVFVHVKAADSLGEDGNYEGKRDFIKKISDAAAVLLEAPDDVLVALTADHTTPCALKTHSGDPVPLLFSGYGVIPDDVTEFGERNCRKGGCGRILGLDLMNEILNILGRAPLYGA
ncbi:MAG: 2,3-bisphosphoglycerate-independent phosphoglycerate mutase [Planctomycetota bacterium]|nr:MAG: 2,3-bisphosphoglycerate-independent phosphoglycerate mutase [Planctomycetota bacterium]